jgi:ribosomal protein S18 acetylase RimI-like enzyme
MSSPSHFAVRSYQRADRPALRRLCCAAAYGEVPLEDFFPDEELFADLMTAYYTDREPGSTLVAVDGAGELAGYLCGAFDTRRQQRVQALRVLPAALLRFAARGGLLRRSTWRLIGANLDRRLCPRGGDLGNEPRPEPDLERYPAHLHLALEPAARGSGLGRRLVEAFLARLAAAGRPGVHAVVRGENASARRFFARLGFRPLARGPALRLPGEPGGDSFKLVYGRQI